MSNFNILQLNKYCVFEILTQILNNCEFNEILDSDLVYKYKDLINVALSCEFFRDAFREWNPNLYRTLDIEIVYLNTSTFIDIKFDEIYQRHQKSTQRSKDTFWKIYQNALKSNTQLETIKLKYRAKTYNKDHGEVLDMIMDALQNKPRLRGLYIEIEGYHLDRLPQLQNLEIFTTTSKINASDLVDFCKSNKNLNVLHLMNNEMFGKLTDIVPHCSNLKELYFNIKTDFHDSEYTQLAKLPNLKILHIQGIHKSASLSGLINALVAKESQTLEIFKIETHINIGDFVNANKIPSLQIFECRLTNIKNFQLCTRRSDGYNIMEWELEREKNATDLDFLINLIKFQSLVIVGKHKTGTLKRFFKAIAEQKSTELEKLEAIKNYSYSYDNDVDADVDNDDDVDKDDDDVNDDNVDDDELKAIKRKHERIIERNKLKKRKRVIEQRKMTLFNNDEILEILKIKSLKLLNCGFSDNQPMKFPTQLPQLNKITIESNEPRSLENLFKVLAQQTPSQLNTLHIGEYPISSEEMMDVLKIKTLTKLICKSKDFFNFYYRKFKRLELFDHSFLFDSHETLLKFLETFKETSITTDKHIRALNITNNFAIKFTVLEQLSMEENHINPQIAKLITSGRIKCYISNPQSIQYFKYLPKLESLEITTDLNFPDVSEEILDIFNEHFKNITVNLNSRKITFNKSLQKLTIINKSNYESVNVQEYAPLAQLEQLRSLYIIGPHKLGSFQDFLIQINKNKTLEEVIFEENTLLITKDDNMSLFNYEECIELSKITTLKRLQCGISDGKCFEVLKNLSNLQDLTLTSYPEESLKQYLNNLALGEYSNLQSLDLSGSSLSVGDIDKIARLQSLKRLKCELADVHNIDQLAKLKELEELSIRADKCNSLMTLLEALTSKKSKTLQQLEITHRPILYKEMKIIVQLKFLSTLFCKLRDTKSNELLIQLPDLKELFLNLHSCDTKNIEILAQLNKLTHLEIKSPGSGSLKELFKRLSSREVQILQTLIIGGSCLDSEETYAIAKLKSLRRLQCRFNHNNHQCLGNLANLEVIKIKTYNDSKNSMKKTQLNILKKCHNIKTIVVYDFFYYFTEEAFEILKTIRNPQVQPALQLRARFTPEQIGQLDERYLIVDEVDHSLDVLRSLF